MVLFCYNAPFGQQRGMLSHWLNGTFDIPIINSWNVTIELPSAPLNERQSKPSRLVHGAFGNSGVTFRKVIIEILSAPFSFAAWLAVSLSKWSVW